MLSIAVKKVDDLIGTLAKVPILAGPIADVRSQAVRTGGDVLPEVRAVGSDIVKFASHTLGVLSGLITGVAGGTPLGVVTQALHDVGTELAAERAKLPSVVTRLGSFRDGLSEDIAKVSKQQERLDTELAGLAAKRQHWASQAAAVHKQSSITTIIGTFIPFVPQAAGEIASQIQYGKSTEEALAQADHELKSVGLQAHNLQTVIGASKELGAAIGQLTTATQNLNNVTSLLSADLAGEAAIATAADPAAATLFLKSLSGSLEMLRAGAA
ncbi:hypothetical protein [Amycolatopsis sp. NPDC051071]|uniref:hypothetical protein n=1 Tax=Amycolatopsis sp. NPDC051071 TaxID=3154637 RepID=UPI0034480ADD